MASRLECCADAAGAGRRVSSWDGGGLVPLSGEPGRQICGVRHERQRFRHVCAVSVAGAEPDEHRAEVVVGEDVQRYLFEPRGNVVDVADAVRELVRRDRVRPEFEFARGSSPLVVTAAAPLMEPHQAKATGKHVCR